ncbi:MAG: cation transporter [Nitrospirae bacterium]|nr:cation transporter [Nitrospirota bacterium]
MKKDQSIKLALSLLITLIILLAEVIGGLVSNSIALLSDAGHVLTDAFALGLSLIAAHISKRPSDFRATFGYQRFGLLAAVINGVSLVVIAVFIFVESYHRFVSPAAIGTTVMLTVAAGGLLGNIAMALILGRGHEDLNIKSAWLHVLGDTLSSVGVIISGLIVLFTGWTYADPVAGIIIGTIIITGGLRVVREASGIFLEMVPRGFDVEAIAEKLCGLPEVMGVHDLHVWSLAHRRVAFTAHIWVHDQKLSELEPLRHTIEDLLRGMKIHHILLQFECGECEANGLYCQVHTEEHPQEHHHH